MGIGSGRLVVRVWVVIFVEMCGRWRSECGMECGRVEGKKVEGQWVEGALNGSIDEYGTWEEFCFMLHEDWEDDIKFKVSKYWRGSDVMKVLNG